MVVETLDWAVLASRMGVALAAGATVGWDRQRNGKPAGVRTHMLVSLGACLLVLVPQGMGASADSVSRTIQGIATGIGFLGGGEILHHFTADGGKSKVKGLTSAAAMWLTAALGIVAGCGLWRMLLLALGAAIVILALGRPIERLLFRKRVKDDAA
jgi:putative Mg2+ transporter-C (MgtC) family protein